MKAITEDDVVLIRPGSGYIHLGIRHRRGWDTMCCQRLNAPSIRTWAGDDAADIARDGERFLCDECVDVCNKPWPIIRRITGW